MGEALTEAGEGRPVTRSRALPTSSSGPCSASPALPLLSIQPLLPTQPTCRICSPHDPVPGPRSSDVREIQGQRLGPPGPLPAPGPHSPAGRGPPRCLISSRSPSSLPHRRAKRRGLPARHALPSHKECTVYIPDGVGRNSGFSTVDYLQEVWEIPEVSLQKTPTWLPIIEVQKRVYSADISRPALSSLGGKVWR